MNLATVAVEFDGALVGWANGLPFWLRGAREFLEAAAASGIKVILHSTAAATAHAVLPGDAEEFFRTGRVPLEVEEAWARFGTMRAFLQAEGMWSLVQVWQAPGKPVADRYLDARAEFPDWAQVGAELGVRLG